MKRVFIALTLLFCVSALASADIYKFVDENGVIHLTNTPRGNGYRKVIIDRPEQEGESIDRIIQQKARKYDIKPSVIRALIKAESNWDVHAVSEKGAIGLMQLMPATAQELKIKNPFDPAQNIEGGTRYLRMLLDRFSGDMELAVAAYNAGPAAVEKSGGIPSFSETRKFVRSVITSFGSKGENRETRIHKITHDDGTIVYTNVPVSHHKSNLQKF